MSYEEFVELALALPDVEEVVGGRELSVQRENRWMFTLKKDGETIALKLDWPTHDRLLESRSDALFKTPHYEGYPAFLVRLPVLDPPLARELLRASWDDAPLKATKRRSA